ncbi:MAG: alpha-E domain-containing protein [Campylobacterales bacterium]|nr:alpha-E domain-containing protein [Campylobacterales bacterium]
MNQILTANVANNLYWLGRYLERAEAALLEINTVYDQIIDVDFEAGKKLYYKLGVDLEYKNAEDFLKQAIIGEHSSNIKDTLDFARENAIISRSFIELEAFGSIIQLHDLFTQASVGGVTIDFIFIDDALSLISEIWGELTRKQTRNVNDYFLILGKSVEKVDFQLRLGKDKKYAIIVMDEIDTIVKILAPNAVFKAVHNSGEDTAVILESINNKINKIIVA